MRGSVRKVERKGPDKWRATLDLPRGSKEDRKQRSRIFETKEKAELWLAKMNTQIGENDMVDDSASSLRSFLELWLEDYAEHQVKKTTRARYRNLIENHINPHLGETALSNLTPTALQQFYGHKLEDGRLDGKEGGLAPRTVKQMHAILHKALKCAVQWQMLNRNPADHVDPPQPEKTTQPTLGMDEVKRFLNTANEHSPYGPVFHLAILVGLRRSEVLGLRWGDVDFDRGTIQIQQTLLEPDDGDIHFGTPKTHRSRRDLKIPQQVQKALKRHKKRQAQRRMRKGPAWQGDDHDLVFTAENGNWIRPRNLYRTYKQILEEADLPDIPLHNLRHSCATLMLEEGEHPKVVQTLLGHKSIKTTLDTYSHVSDDLQGRASQSLADTVWTEGQNRASGES